MIARRYLGLEVGYPGLRDELAIERDHPVAHFHAHHAGRRASVSVNGEVLAGSLDPRALQFVREWARPRKGEIMANWERARRNEQLLAIEPLA